MSQSPRNHLADLGGASRLAVDATAGITGLVEALHATIAARARIPGDPVVGPAVDAVTGLVYSSVRGITRTVGTGLDVALGLLAPALGDLPSSPARDATVAAVNGVLGDYLAETGNPLAIRMGLFSGTRRLDLEPDALAASLPGATGKVLVMLHGLCMSHGQWQRRGHDHGAQLAHELGYTPVHVNYNSGLHVSENGRALAEWLEALAKAWPVEIRTIDLVGHSMGGLVARSAIAQARLATHEWLRRVGRVVFLGTPHHGAPLERGGQWIEMLLEATPYTAPFTMLGRIRSAGITDLRYGCLLEEDWRDSDRFTAVGDTRQPVPLPEGVEGFAVAATLGTASDHLTSTVVGDGLVPVRSALGDHADPRLALALPALHRRLVHGAGHLDLLSRRDVYEQIRDWLAGRGPS